MSSSVSSLPTDIETLQSLLLTERSEKQRLEAKVISLQEQLNLALARRYAASSEKLSPDQIRLFDEAESEAAEVARDC